MKIESEWNSERMWLTSVSQLHPLVVWICIQRGTSKTQQPRQTMARWLIRCVRLLLEKVRDEIKRHFEHPTGVYWKGAGMLRMSAVWVCPWMKGAHKMCLGATIETVIIPEDGCWESPPFYIPLRIKWIKKYPLQTWNLELQTTNRYRFPSTASYF